VVEDTGGTLPSASTGNPLSDIGRPVLPGTVTTARLELRLISAEEAAGMLAGRRKPDWHPDYPRQDDLDGVSMVRADVTAAERSWGSRHVVRTFDGLVCGSIGFFGPPEAAADGTAEVEVGYGLVADARGHGAATEALQGLLVEADRAGVRVRASVEPDNRASVRVLAKCGFTELRGSDEEGNLVMARPLPDRR
jgi:RimJ/RimL family protein N-acetyltransferase